MSRFVITGGLGAGKSSVLAALRGRYATVPESARELIAEHRAVTGEPTLDHRPEVFVERLISRTLRAYRSVSPGEVTLFDRGLPDCVAYAAVTDVDPNPALEAAAANRYEEPVFVAPPWPAIYANDDMRRATFAEAELFYLQVTHAYGRLGYELIEIPKASIERRAAWISARLP